jgi:hypothetical protein
MRSAKSDAIHAFDKHTNALDRPVFRTKGLFRGISKEGSSQCFELFRTRDRHFAQGIQPTTSSRLLHMYTVWRATPTATCNFLRSPANQELYPRLHAFRHFHPLPSTVSTSVRGIPHMVQSVIMKFETSDCCDWPGLLNATRPSVVPLVCSIVSPVDTNKYRYCTSASRAVLFQFDKRSLRLRACADISFRRFELPITRFVS